MSSGFVFRVTARSTARKRGEVWPDAGVKAIEFSTPPEFQGEAGYWSPEHLLLAAVGSCFTVTFRATAEISRFAVESFAMGVEGLVEKGEGGFQVTEVHLKPAVIIQQESDRERAIRLLEKTERGCLISRSLKCRIVLEPDIQVGAALAVPADSAETHPVAA